MFADGYFSISFPELVGTIVTIVGIWLVVKQLNETRLASQMEGMLALGERVVAIREHRNILFELVNLDEWNSLSAKEAHTRIYESKLHLDAYSSAMTLFELLGILVRRKALDKGLAYDFYGRVTFVWWNRLAKITQQRRIEENREEIGEHWEWLAKEFEKRVN